MQDGAIVESVLSGDVQAFELLVMKYQKSVYLSAYGILKNQSAAEDIVQDAFVKAFEKLDTLKNRDGFHSWVKKIAINLALNSYDRSKWNVDVTTDEDGFDFFDNVPVYNGPEQLAINEELKSYLKLFVDALPDKLRLVLVMRELDELSYEEIAEILDIPVGTVRSRLYNARQVLKERLVAQGLADSLYQQNEV